MYGECNLCHLPLVGRCGNFIRESILSIVSSAVLSILSGGVFTLTSIQAVVREDNCAYYCHLVIEYLSTDTEDRAW